MQALLRRIFFVARHHSSKLLLMTTILTIFQLPCVHPSCIDEARKIAIMTKKDIDFVGGYKRQQLKGISLKALLSQKTIQDLTLLAVKTLSDKPSYWIITEVYSQVNTLKSLEYSVSK